jgi:hypothetical protein
MKFEQKTKKLPPYHKVQVRIGTLEVTPLGPVAVIPFPYVNCTRTTSLALRPLIPRWKEVMVPPPVGFTIYGQSFATRSLAT